jgi:transposase
MAPVGRRAKRSHAGRFRGFNRGALPGPHECARAVAHPPALGLAAKKKALSATERHRPQTPQARVRFRTKLSKLPPKDLVFVDESGVRTNLTRLYGRAPKGERVREAVPQGHWKVLTILSALTVPGIAARMTIEAATDADVFLTFVQQVLAPRLRPGQIVILDNLPAHQHKKVRRLLAARQCRLLYLPPYSPDLNPIEFAWSKLKTFLRAAKARQGPALEQAITTGLRTMTAQNARNWFRRCGYPL